jgi:hypothetical protein
MPLDEQNTNNPNDEIILLYNWAWASNNLKEGYLEESANHLMAMLLSPPKILGIGSAQLMQKPMHFIGHSRGAILLLQLAYKLGYYFGDIPAYDIEQLTMLDPHPAVPMGDCRLQGIVGSCKISLKGEKYNFEIQLPKNVLSAENYYRHDGIYEDMVHNGTVGSFDGIPIAGAEEANFLLNDSLLSLGSSKMGGSHAVVATSWYYATIDHQNTFQHPVEPHWFEADDLYPKMGPKEKTGFYHSRLGGGPMPRKTPANYKVKPISPGYFIFNGDFQMRKSELFGPMPGWTYNGGGGRGLLIADGDNNFVRLKVSKTKDENWRRHSWVFFPKTIEKQDYVLSFDYRAKDIAGAKLKVYLSLPEEEEETLLKEIAPKNSDDFTKLTLPIPARFKGKTVRFKFELEGEMKQQLDIDNIELQ